MSEQELLAKARAKLSSLQMAELYNLIEKNGEIVGVAYCYCRVVVNFKNGKKAIYQMWQQQEATTAFFRAAGDRAQAD